MDFHALRTIGFYSHTVVADRAEALIPLTDLTDGKAVEKGRIAKTGTCDVVEFPGDLAGQKTPSRTTSAETKKRKSLGPAGFEPATNGL